MHHPSILVDTATPETFDGLAGSRHGELVVVEFWGKACPNCELLAKAMPGLLDALSGEAVRMVTVDAYTYPDLARRFGVFGIPCFLLFRGGVRLGRMSEFRGRDYWLGVVHEHLPKADQ